MVNRRLPGARFRVDIQRRSRLACETSRCRLRFLIDRRRRSVPNLTNGPARRLIALPARKPSAGCRAGAEGEAKVLIGTFWPIASSSSGNRSQFRWIEHGQSGRLCDLSLYRRLRCLDPYCRPKLQRARFMDLRRSHPHSDRPLERFLRHLKIHPLRGTFARLSRLEKPDELFSLTKSRDAVPASF
jgi:hypothetical protein